VRTGACSRNFGVKISWKKEDKKGKQCKIEEKRAKSREKGLDIWKISDWKTG